MTPSPAKPFAVVFTYVLREDRTYATTFRGADALTRAHAFRKMEEESGDWPDALWAVTGNDAATEERSRRLLTAMGLESVDA